MAKDKNFKKGNSDKGYKGKGKGSKDNGSKPKTSDGAEVVSNSVNDIGWLSKNPEILKSAGKLSTNNPIGLKVDLMGNSGETSLEHEDYIAPGIFKLRVLPSIGISKDGTSDVNKAMRTMYAFVRHANSGSRNYEAPDYMMYLMAMRGLYDFYSEMVRLYGLTRVYSHVNRYIAKGLVTALGYDYDDIVKNLADFRYYINTYAVRVNAYAAPKELSYYDRAAFIPLHVFKDSAEDKAGLYVLQYEKYYRWDGTFSQQGSCLRPEYFDDTKLNKLSDIIALGDKLINAMMTNEDCGIMMGDTLKAFGANGLRQLAAIPEDYATLPVYNQMVLHQIHNTVFAGSTQGNLNVLQDEHGNIIFNPRFAQVRHNEASCLSPLLDADVDDPTPEWVVEATQGMVCFGELGPEGSYITLDSSGSEIFTTFSIYTLSSDGASTPFASPDFGTLYPTIVPANSLISEAGIVYLSQKALFDWAPIIYINKFDQTKTKLIPFGEIFNYTPMSRSTIAKLHNCALLSLFNIAGLGKPI